MEVQEIHGLVAKENVGSQAFSLACSWRAGPGGSHARSSAPIRPAVHEAAASRRKKLPDFESDSHRQVAILLGVDLRGVGLGMAEQDLGGFEAGFPANAGGVGVADLVRMPAVLLLPLLELQLLFATEA